ncbi:MAG TPA: N-6 DNA methylase [Fulvivirga sp.]|nr:N-6 DNA methylase [Fulvivirga sp.]
MTKADINFEKELWDAANELRGAVSENNYKNYILPLVFLKHLSERYDIVHGEIEVLLNDPKSEYYTVDKEEISYVLEDHDEYRSRNTFKIPKTASWQYLKDNAEQDDIKVKVDDAFDALQDLLTEFNPQLNNLLPRIFVKSELSPKQTGGIINLLSHPKFSEKENPESDILGRIYEYYIGRFAMAEGSGAGQFFTPGSIVRLLVEILEPYKGRIFDPACGSGGMFVQSLKFVNEHGGNKNDISIYGQEMTAQTLRLCLMNLMLRNLSFDIKLGNSLLDDKFPTLKADYVIANPPFNVSNWHPEDLPDGDPRLFGPKEEYTTDGSANYMWMQTFWHHLSDTGTAGIVMANGAMTSNTAGEKKVRQHMVDNSMVDAIVRLPDKLFLTTGIPACIFILSKNRDGKDGIHRERNNEILFIDASKMGTMASRKLRVFSDEDIKQISKTYHLWRTNYSPPFQENSTGNTISNSPPFKEESPQGEVVNNLPHLKTFRKELRNNSTPAEATLWTLLSGKKLEGRKFRRQHSVANYILDFYCPSEKLAIELDGQGHFEATQAEYDAERDLFLNHYGIKVLRFENKEVFKHSEALLEQVKSEFGWYNNHPALQAPLLLQGENHPALQAPLLSKEGNGNVEQYQDTPGFCKAATLADVQKQDYKLTPGIYVGTEAELDDGIPFEEKMQGLKAQLMEQFEKGDELKKQIVVNFEKL